MSEIPEPPTELPADARRYWDQFAPDLAAAGRLIPSDAPTLAQLCIAYAHADEAAVLIAKDGMTRKDENKVERKHPAFQILREARQTIARLSRRFGLDPESRAKSKVQGPAEDPLKPLIESRRRCGFTDEGRSKPLEEVLGAELYRKLTA